MKQKWIMLGCMTLFFPCHIQAGEVRHFDGEEAAIVRGDYDGAIRELTRAIDSGKLSNEEKVIAYGDRSTAYLQKNAYREAAADASVVIRLNPASPYGYVTRGLAYCMLGKNDRGVADFNIALPRLMGDDAEPMAYYGRGTCFLHRQEYKKAISDFDRALQLNPRYVVALTNRGASFMSMQMYKQAFADFSAAAQLAPGDADVQFNKGLAQMYLKQEEGALTDFGEAIRIQPGLAKAYFWRGAIYASRQMYDKAMQDFDEVIRLKPQAADIYSRAYIDRGHIHLTRNEPDLAIADLSAALQIDPAADIALYYRSIAYFERGDNQSALADSDATIRLGKDSAPAFAYYGRGSLRFLLGRFDEAISDFEQAIRRDPNDRSAYLLLYVSLAKTGNTSMTGFKRTVSKLKLDKWPDPILAMYLGRSTPDQVRTLAAQGESGLDLSTKKCQAPFYIGEYELRLGRIVEATRLMKEAVDVCSADTIESRFAAIELVRLKGG